MHHLVGSGRDDYPPVCEHLANQVLVGVIPSRGEYLGFSKALPSDLWIGAIHRGLLREVTIRIGDDILVE